MKMTVEELLKEYKDHFAKDDVWDTDRLLFDSEDWWKKKLTTLETKMRAKERQKLLDDVIRSLYFIMTEEYSLSSETSDAICDRLYAKMGTAKLNQLKEA
jgi:hypothetical protein